MVNTIMKVLLRAVALILGGVSVFALFALLARPSDRAIILVPAAFFLLLAVALWYWSSLPARQSRALALTQAFDKQHQCECCDFFTIDEPRVGAACVICTWRQTEDGLEQLDRSSNANDKITLRSGRANTLKCGAAIPTNVKTMLPFKHRERYRYVQRTV
jgi:hypothetical protein